MLMSALPPGLSIVVPAYNSGEILPQLVERLHPVLQATGQPFELVIVNDGSRDNTWPVIQQLARDNSWVRGFCNMRNYGQHNALLCGIRAACFDKICTMDDDLQHPPEELPKLLAALKDDIDVVYAPPDKEQHGLLRDLASIITKTALQSAMGGQTARQSSAWRLFRTRIRDAFAQYRSPLISIDVLLTWATTRFVACPLRHDVRTIGKSNYTFGKLVRHAFNMMTGFSVLPLQIASMVGFAFTLFGVGVLAYVLIRYMTVGSAVQGFPFLASVIAIFSGAQLFALGIIGEYLARMHFRIMDKPTYVLRDSTDEDKSPPSPPPATVPLAAYRRP
jgi:undecaprenyl-phosphate 4-deoxy-4-formamido-L-arabinose transferase